MNIITPGRLVIIEGLGRSGKGLTTERLKQRLPKETLFTYEPGGTRLSKELRELLLRDENKFVGALPQIGMFCSARLLQTEEIILPALQKGQNVVCERWDASTFAYQVWGAGGHQGIQLFRAFRAAQLSLVRPYLYVFLDIPPEVAVERMKVEGNTRHHFHKKDPEFFAKVRQGYREFLSGVPCRMVDANRPIEVVADEVYEIVQSALA